MKKIIVAALATSALSMAGAADCSPQEFELGTVETVHQVPVFELLPDVFEHPVKPQTLDR